jgi:putative ABC transport system permease protein
MNLESIRYSLRNINYRKGRSFLTVFSILIGIATIFLFISFGAGLYTYIDDVASSSSANKLIIQSKGGFGGIDESFELDNDDLSVVERAAGVRSASGLYFKTAKIEKGDEQIYTYLAAFDPDSPLIIEVFGIEIEKGRELKSGDSGVVLGHNYAIPGKIFEKGVSLNDNIEIQGKKLKVLGFYEEIGSPPDDAQVYIASGYLENLYPGENDYSWVVAEVNIEEIEKAKTNIERGLRKHRNLEEGKEDFYVQSFADLIESYSGALDIVIGFIILIALISVLVSAINTANTMITSVLERYKEIGILKAIGARNSEVFKIFLFESSFLGFIAGTLGVLVGWGLASLGGVILAEVGYSFLQPYFSIWTFVGCVAFATLTGAVSGALPALRASKINPVDALRYE